MQGNAMRKQRGLLTIAVSSGLVALIGIGVRGDQADEPNRLTALDVIRLWEPKIDGVDDYQAFEAPLEGSPRVAVQTFRVVGPSFGRLWNHYADLCGIAHHYEPKRFLTSSKAGTKGSYIVSDRASSDAKGGRSLSVFLLRTDGYTVTATIQPDPAAKAVLGSIVAATP
jgi:hypothetical protein